MRLEGRSDAAREWFESAASLDLDGRFDATDRIAALDGITLPEDFETEDPAEKTDPEDEMETQVIDVDGPAAGAVVKRVAPGDAKTRRRKRARRIAHRRRMTQLARCLHAESQPSPISVIF